jgi:hypothetical protein
MGWLEDALRNYAKARKRLDTEQPMPTDTPTGGTQAPLGNNTRPDPQEALQLAMEGYSKYLRKSGNEQEPLLDTVTSTARRRGGVVSGNVAEHPALGALVPDAGGQSYRVTTHGPREGMVHQRYQLRDGTFANVYYDPETGAREVVRFGNPRHDRPSALREDPRRRRSPHGL